MTDKQKELIRDLLMYASTVGVQDAMDGHYEADGEGNTYNEYLNEKEFEEVADFIRTLIKD